MERKWEVKCEVNGNQSGNKRYLYAVNILLVYDGFLAISIERCILEYLPHAAAQFLNKLNTR